MSKGIHFIKQCGQKKRIMRPQTFTDTAKPSTSADSPAFYIPEPIIPGPDQGIVPYPFIAGRNGLEIVLSLEEIRRAAPPYGPGHALLASYDGATKTLNIPAGTVLYTCHAADVEFSLEKAAFYGSNPVVALCGSKRIRSRSALRNTSMYAVQFTQDTAIKHVFYFAKAGGTVEELNKYQREHIAPFSSVDGYGSSVLDPCAVEVAIKLEPRPYIKLRRCMLFTDPAICLWVKSTAAAPYLSNYKYRGRTRVKHLWPVLAMRYQLDVDHVIDQTHFQPAREADNAPGDLELAVQLYPYLALVEFYDVDARDFAQKFEPYRELALKIVKPPQASDAFNSA